MICSFNFLIFLVVCLNIYTVINIKILTKSNQQTQSYKFTSHMGSFSFCGFDHRDAWKLHTNIIWSKCSTDLPVVYGTTLRQVWLYIVYDEVCQWLAAGQWFSPVISVIFINKTDCNFITKILLKVVLNNKVLINILF